MPSAAFLSLKEKVTENGKIIWGISKDGLIFV